MIHLDHVTKTFVLRGRRKTVADNITATFPTGAVIGLLGRNGAGKTTMMQMIAGNMEPTRGRILSTGTISYPVGFAGSFHGELTGAQNARFVARIYGIDTEALLRFVEDFAELGKHFHLPVRTYSSGMKSRLAFGVSMGIKFDTYLVDEVTAVGDASFKKKSEELFRARMEESSAVMVTHALGQVQRLCDHVAVLEDGQLYYFTNVMEGIAFHQENMRKAPEDDG